MSRLSKQFPRESEWEEIATKLARWHKIPEGSRFDIVYDAHPSYGDRKVRKNFRVKRKLFKHAQHPRVEDNRDIRIAEVLANIEAMLALNLRQRRMRLVAVGPDGSILSGSRMMRSWRRDQPAITAAQRDERRMRDLEIDTQLRPLARDMIAQLEELLDDPEQKAPHAILIELNERFGVATMEQVRRQLGRRSRD